MPNHRRALSVVRCATSKRRASRAAAVMVSVVPSAMEATWVIGRNVADMATREDVTQQTERSGAAAERGRGRDQGRSRGG